MPQLNIAETYKLLESDLIPGRVPTNSDYKKLTSSFNVPTDNPNFVKLTLKDMKKWAAGLFSYAYFAKNANTWNTFNRSPAGQAAQKIGNALWHAITTRLHKDQPPLSNDEIDFFKLYKNYLHAIAESTFTSGDTRLASMAGFDLNLQKQTANDNHVALGELLINKMATPALATNTDQLAQTTDTQSAQGNDTTLQSSDEEDDEDIFEDAISGLEDDDEDVSEDEDEEEFFDAPELTSEELEAELEARRQAEQTRLTEDLSRELEKHTAESLPLQEAKSRTRLIGKLPSQNMAINNLMFSQYKQQLQSSMSKLLMSIDNMSDISGTVKAQVKTELEKHSTKINAANTTRELAKSAQALSKSLEDTTQTLAKNSYAASFAQKTTGSALSAEQPTSSTQTFSAIIIATLNQILTLFRTIINNSSPTSANSRCGLFGSNPRSKQDTTQQQRQTTWQHTQ